MALTYRGEATLQTGSTSVTVGNPTGTVQGDLALLYAATKNSSADPANPAGWTRFGSWVVGTGVDGAGTGQIRLTLWWRVWETTPGSAVISNTSGNSIIAGCLSWSKGSGDTAPFNLYANVGSDTTSGTDFSTTMGSNLGFVTGDHALLVGATTDNAQSRNADDWTCPGMTFPARTQVNSGTTTQGNDLALWTSRVGAATAGTQSAANTVTATLASAGTGGALTVRISLVASGTNHAQTATHTMGLTDVRTSVLSASVQPTHAAGLTENVAKAVDLVPATEDTRLDDPYPTFTLNGTPIDFTFGTLTLRTVWMNLASDLSDYVSFPMMSSLVFEQAAAPEVRRLAKGRMRLIRRSGDARTVKVVLRGCDRDQVAWLEEHVGDLVCVRDDRGRKTYGVYLGLSASEYRTEQELTDINIDLREIFHEEGVDQ